MKRLGCTGAIVLFFVAAVVVTFFIEGGDRRPGGVKDAGARGHLALLLLLKELGFDPAVHTGSPKDLAASGPGILILPALPKEDQLDPNSESSFGLRWYATYVERGGDLILPVSRFEDLYFLRDQLALGGLGVDLDFGSYRGEFEVTIPSSGGERLRLTSDSERLLEVTTIGAGRDRVELWRAGTPGDAGDLSADEVPVGVVIIQSGLGRIVVVAAPSAFENLRLPEADNALFFVRLIEHLQAGRASPPPPTFDQYVILGANPNSWFGALFRPPLLPTTLSVLLVLLVWAWSVSARRSFPLDRRLAHRPPPAERARALAGLMSRARHPEWLEPRAVPVASEPEQPTDSPPGVRAESDPTLAPESDE